MGLKDDLVLELLVYVCEDGDEPVDERAGGNIVEVDLNEIFIVLIMERRLVSLQ